MSFLSFARERRKTYESTPEGQEKALKRRKKMRVGKILFLVFVIAFLALCVIVTLNNHFHWWVTLPFGGEKPAETSEPIATSSSGKIFP